MYCSEAPKTTKPAYVTSRGLGSSGVLRHFSNRWPLSPRLRKAEASATTKLHSPYEQLLQGGDGVHQLPLLPHVAPHQGGRVGLVEPAQLAGAVQRQPAAPPSNTRISRPSLNTHDRHWHILEGWGQRGIGGQEHSLQPRIDFNGKELTMQMCSGILCKPIHCLK